MPAENVPSERLPMATVARHIKKKTGDKQVSQKVKVAVNQFLSDVTEIVSKELDHNLSRGDHKTITDEDLRQVTEPFRYAANLDTESEKVVKELEAMRHKVDNLITEFRAKFGIEEQNKTFALSSASSTSVSGSAVVTATPQLPPRKPGKTIDEMSDDEIGF